MKIIYLDHHFGTLNLFWFIVISTEWKFCSKILKLISMNNRILAPFKKLHCEGNFIWRFQMVVIWTTEIYFIFSLLGNEWTEHILAIQRNLCNIFCIAQQTMRTTYMQYIWAEKMEYLTAFPIIYYIEQWRILDSLLQNEFNSFPTNVIQNDILKPSRRSLRHF